MKEVAKISKSAVMKRAWAIFRGTTKFSRNFSLALKRAWEVEKDDVRRISERIEREKIEAKQTNKKSYFNPQSMADYYASSCYKGD